MVRPAGCPGSWALRAARALGRDGLAFQWDAVRAVVTRYDSAQQAVPVIMRHLEAFGDAAGGTP